MRAPPFALVESAIAAGDSVQAGLASTSSVFEITVPSKVLLVVALTMLVDLARITVK